MLRQTIALLLGWALALAWLGFAHSTVPSNADLWAQFQESADPQTFDALILRGAFGSDGIPELAEWLSENVDWRVRINGLHPLEAKGLRQRTGR